jgi:predicted nucleotidyltransferase
MGTDLSEIDSGIMREAGTSGPLWLDPKTWSLVCAITFSVASRHPDLRAVILYGSVARHEERSLYDAEPSDVDLLLLFDLDPKLARLPYQQEIAISRSIGLARERHLDAPREVQVMLAVRDLADWDPTFVEGVARDGLLLWARGPLPAPLAPVASRPLLSPAP